MSNALMTFVRFYILVAIPMAILVYKKARDEEEKLKKQGMSILYRLFLYTFVHFLTTIIFTCPLFGVVAFLELILM